MRKNLRGLFVLLVVSISFATNVCAENCNTLLEEWFGNDVQLFSANDTYQEQIIETITKYFDIRETSLYEYNDIECDFLGNVVLSTENKRRLNIIEMQKKMNIDITNAASHIEINNITEVEDTYHITLYEWIFYDYDDLDTDVYTVSVSGYGVEHNLVINSNLIIVSDLYDESDLTGISSVEKDEVIMPSVSLMSSDDGISLMNMYAGYNPDTVAAYADKYALNYNTNYYNFNSVGGDCANFTSQSIYAGGMPQVVGTAYGTDGWYYKSSSDRSGTWTKASYLRTWMANNRGTLVNDPSKSQVYKGSPVFYDWHNDGSWDHAAICVGTNTEGVPVVDSHNTDHYHIKWNYGYSDTRHSIVQLTNGNHYTPEEPETVVSKSPTFAVQSGTTGSNTIFSWNTVEGASSYNLKIWKDSYLEGNAYINKANVSSGIGISLPVGTYYAYIDACNSTMTDWKMSNIVSFKVVEMTSPTLTVNAGTTGSNTIFTWNAVEGASSYNLKIWKDSYLEGSAYINKTDVPSGIGISLPVGTYYAYIDACNSTMTDWKMSNIVSFRVVDIASPTLSVQAGTTGSDTIFSWNTVEGATSYNLKVWKDNYMEQDPYVNMFNVSPNVSVRLPAGQYYAYVDAWSYDLNDWDMSNIISFRVTGIASSISVITNHHEKLDDTTVRVNASYYNPELVTVKKYGFYYGTNKNNMKCVYLARNENYVNGGIYYDLINLVSGQTYYYQAFVSDGTLEQRGEIRSFSITKGILCFQTIEYNNHLYVLFEDTLSWWDAKQECEKLGGHLATVTSNEEYDVILSLLKSKEANVWLGATDEESEGIWQWITGENFAFKNWDISQPDNANNDEHYLCQLNKDYSYVWYDIPNDAKRGFICEFEKTTSKIKANVYKTTHCLNVDVLLFTDNKCKVIVCGYKENNFVDMDSKDYNDSEDLSFTVNGDIDKIKVMVWSDLSTLKPLCEAEEITSDKFIIE